MVIHSQNWADKVADLATWKALAFACLSLADAGQLEARSPRLNKGQACHEMAAAYRIYAENDFVKIANSKHTLVAVSDGLDRELSKRGWQKMEARGRFTLCGPRKKVPMLW